VAGAPRRSWRSQLEEATRTARAGRPFGMRARSCSTPDTALASRLTRVPRREQGWAEAGEALVARARSKRVARTVGVAIPPAAHLVAATPASHLERATTPSRCGRRSAISPPPTCLPSAARSPRTRRALVLRCGQRFAPGRGTPRQVARRETWRTLRDRSRRCRRWRGPTGLGRPRASAWAAARSATASTGPRGMVGGHFRGSRLTPARPWSKPRRARKADALLPARSTATRPARGVSLLLGRDRGRSGDGPPGRGRALPPRTAR